MLFLQIITPEVSCHTFSAAEGLCRRLEPSSTCLGVLFPKRKGSGGHLLYVSWQRSTWLRGYHAPPISLWSEHGPLLPEGNPLNQRADSLRRCYRERGEEGLQGGGRKRNGESGGNDNVCAAISPWQWPPHPRGGLGATRLQPQCSVLLMSLMTLLSHLMANCVDNVCVQCLSSSEIQTNKGLPFLEKKNNLVILTDNKLIQIWYMYVCHRFQSMMCLNAMCGQHMLMFVSVCVRRYNYKPTHIKFI